MTSQDILDLEREIGFVSNSRDKLAEEKLRQNITSHMSKRAVVYQWLIKQGLPEKTVRQATVASLVNAYLYRPYLQAWRKRVNPSWDLLASTSLDDEDEFTPMANGNNGMDVTHSNPPMPQSEATGNWLKDLFVQINSAVNTIVNDRLDNTTLKLDPAAKEQIKLLARSSAKELIEELARPRVIEIHNHVAASVTSLGLQHERFPILLRAMQAKDHRNFRLNIWLTGPTGSGKTSACENAAKALSLPFGSDGSLDADYKVLGFRDANGNIISTQFLQIYENGGIYVADEIDNWMPSALLSLNAALANGWVSSPKGMIQRHPDACVIACANTWGLGATGDYVGRTRLDAASLDRFQPKIDWPYDEKLERAIADNMAGDTGTQWHDTVISARRKAKTNGLKIIISPRATFNGISLLNAGFDHTDVVDMTICAGITPEQKKALEIIPVAKSLKRFLNEETKALSARLGIEEEKLTEETMWESVMIIHYDSIAALRQAYIDAGLRGVRSAGGGNDASWFNNETESDSLRLSLSGDTSLVPSAETMLEQFDQVIETPRRVWERNVAGPFVVVPYVLAGLPTPFRRMQHTTDEFQPIEIFVVTNSAGALSAKVLERRGIAILAFVMALSRSRPVSLYQTFMGNGSYDHTGETLLTAKINTAPLDLATACYILTSAGYARRITYELGRKLNGYSYAPPSAFEYRYPERYELKMAEKLAIDPKRALIIGRSNLEDKLITNPLAWINSQIARFTQKDEEDVNV